MSTQLGVQRFSCEQDTDLPLWNFWAAEEIENKQLITWKLILLWLQWHFEGEKWGEGITGREGQKWVDEIN